MSNPKLAVLGGEGQGTLALVFCSADETWTNSSGACSARRHAPLLARGLSVAPSRARLWRSSEHIAVLAFRHQEKHHCKSTSLPERRKTNLR